MASRLLAVSMFVAVLLLRRRQACLSTLICMQAFCLGHTSTLALRDEHQLHSDLLLTMRAMQHTYKSMPVCGQQSPAWSHVHLLICALQRLLTPGATKEPEIPEAPGWNETPVERVIVDPYKQLTQAECLE